MTQSGISSGVVFISSQLSIIPGAPLSYGMLTRAAYGGSAAPTVIKVTHLRDDGTTGSLRIALTAAFPRIIVFEVSGYVVLNSEILILNPYFYIAGSTAPSPGISTRRYGILIMSHDFLFKHFAVRVGDEGASFPTNNGPDGLFCYTDQCYNGVIANCSVCWVEGESTGTVSPPAVSNVTYYRNIISEGLHFSVKVAENSHGMVIYPGTTNFASIQNLFAHNVERNPECQEGSQTLIVNDVVYDYGQTDNINYYPSAHFFYQGGRLSNAPFLSSNFSSKYIKGPTMPTGKYAIYTYSGDTGSQLYYTDIAVEGVTLYGNNMSFDPRVGSPPIALPSGFTPVSSASVEAYVKLKAGTRPTERNLIDARILNDVTNRTGTWISSQSQVGGFPSLAENFRSLVVPSNPHDITSNGRTVLENWLIDFDSLVET